MIANGYLISQKWITIGIPMEEFPFAGVNVDALQGERSKIKLEDKLM